MEVGDPHSTIEEEKVDVVFEFRVGDGPPFAAVVQWLTSEVKFGAEPEPGHVPRESERVDNASNAVSLP